MSKDIGANKYLPGAGYGYLCDPLTMRQLGTLSVDGVAMPDNLVHGSDSAESAKREIALWFPDGLV